MLLGPLDKILPCLALNKYLQFLKALLTWAVGWSSGSLLFISVTHRVGEVEMYILLLNEILTFIYFSILDIKVKFFLINQAKISSSYQKANFYKVKEWSFSPTPSINFWPVNFSIFFIIFKILQIIFRFTNFEYYLENWLWKCPNLWPKQTPYKIHIRGFLASVGLNF